MTIYVKKREPDPETISVLTAHLQNAIDYAMPQVIVEHRRSLLREAIKGHPIHIRLRG